MSTSSTSDAAVEDLLAGKTLGDPACVGPLTEPESSLLRVLWTNRAKLAGCKGDRQASELRRLVREAAATASPPADSNTGFDPEVVGSTKDRTVVTPVRWRLLEVRCHAFRGVAPAGAEFSFRFDGQSHLIYGPNGAGKSSLLNAVGWVFTGRICTDGEAAESFPVYAAGNKKPAKLHEWPVETALPVAIDSSTVAADCWAEVTLAADGGRRTITLRRKVKSGPQVSIDGGDFQDGVDLASHGITPLDIQLSVSAAVTFGCRTIEAADDSRTLLSLFLGHDALEEFAAMLTPLSGNLTKAANAERKQASAKLVRVREKLASLPTLLTPGTEPHAALVALANAEPGSGAIANALEQITVAAASATNEAVHQLGLQENDPAARQAMVDGLTTAVAALSSEAEDLFPAVSRLLKAVPAVTDGEDVRNRITQIDRGVDEFVAAAKGRIAARLEWWRQELQTAGRASLLLQAAQHFHAEQAECPVCDQSVLGRPAAAELTRLQGENSDLLLGLSEFFTGLIAELRELLPEDLWKVDDLAPAVRLRDDWASIRKSVGPALSSIADRFEAPVADLINECKDTTPPQDSIGVESADATFQVEADRFSQELGRVRRAVAALHWAAAAWPELCRRLTLILTAPGKDEGQAEPGAAESLLSLLRRGKLAAADYERLAAVKADLQAVATQVAEAETGVATAADYEGYRSSLESLKGIGKYAEAEVGRVLGEIEGRMKENLGLLSPRVNRPLTTSRVAVQRGRDGNVETYLAGDGYEVPSRHVSNAGQQRAQALAFFFALLELHPRGLEFILLDDPILSLDEDHRESWANHLLRPYLQGAQVVLATHQRQFLLNCAAYFSPGLQVELNHRDFSRAITWRPGHRLGRAAALLGGDWTSAANEMRKYREDLLLTLDAYCQDKLFA